MGWPALDNRCREAGQFNDRADASQGTLQRVPKQYRAIPFPQ